ncbi:MAG: amidohydrolase family protein, partial [Planctomycetaceae bacterium]|nr:amidohydrolase family protein [Planctomycetaceae bacterium]
SSFLNDGVVGRTTDGNLASGVLGLDHMVRHMAQVTSASLPEVVRMVSLTPASRIGLESEIGSLAVGKRADVVVLDAELQVRDVYCRGVRVPGIDRRGSLRDPTRLFAK